MQDELRDGFSWAVGLGMLVRSAPSCASSSRFICARTVGQFLFTACVHSSRRPFTLRRAQGVRTTRVHSGFAPVVLTMRFQSCTSDFNNLECFKFEPPMRSSWLAIIVFVVGRSQNLIDGVVQLLLHGRRRIFGHEHGRPDGLSCGYPDSAIVGTFGSAGRRLSLTTPRIFTFPCAAAATRPLQS